MAERPLVSICIPSYKRPENVSRLLESVRNQTLTNIEIVISDDSPDDSVQNAIGLFPDLKITYIKNRIPLGTPENWNFAIKNATGEWIKIMHDDDWFATPDALSEFLRGAGQSKFIFSAYQNVSHGKEMATPHFASSMGKRIISEPVLLLAKNVIGPPSVCIVHSSIKEFYDSRLKWRVDIDFYIRLIRFGHRPFFIDKRLINVGVSETQVTNVCIDNPSVELPEGLILLQKFGTKPLRNIWIYDAWWRIIRNVGVRSINDIKNFSGGSEWPEVIIRLVEFQSRWSLKLLHIGLISKFLMLVSYIKQGRSLAK